ncbi:hypothetical protein DFJ74DRAFT_84700 [Hyaloraphidium curvatum]|nr:hypothetical protein DFJ74DRAFT_84700 [Hyaloraphidium curvatum]
MGNPFSKPASDVRDGMRGAGSEAAGILAPEIRGAVSTLAAAMRDGFAALTSFSTVLAKMGGDAAKVLGKSAVRTGDVIGGHMVEAVKEGSKQLKSASKHVGRAAKGAADTVHRAAVSMCQIADWQTYALLTFGYWMLVSFEAWLRTVIFSVIFCIIAVTVFCCWRLLARPATAAIFKKAPSCHALCNILNRPWHPLTSPLVILVWVLWGLFAADQWGGTRRSFRYWAGPRMPSPCAIALHKRAVNSIAAIAYEYQQAINPRRRALKSIAYE